MNKIAGLVLIVGLTGYPTSPQLAGTITLSENPSVDTPGHDTFTYSNDAFTSHFVQMKGEVLAAYVSENGAWSLNTIQVRDGQDSFDYPIIASVKGSDGIPRTVLPATIEAKIAVPSGRIQSGGYLIETKRPIKPGDSIPVLVVSGATVVSIEAASSKTTSNTEPWLFAIKESSNGKVSRAMATEAWRLEKNHVQSARSR